MHAPSQQRHDFSRSPLSRARNENSVAAQQHDGFVRVRSVTTISNLLRMLYSRAGDYPPGQGILYAESFSPNTPEGACPTCHGLGRVYDATEASMVRDPSLSIREGAGGA